MKSYNQVGDGSDRNYFNRKTRITASSIGVFLGLAGILNHGIFEILQGSKPTNGFFIEAIGEAHRFWVHGTEGAITVVPNFLVTGILVVAVGLSIIIWSVKYIHLKHGTTIFLCLTVLLILVGGGIGFVVVFIPTWAFATRINKSLAWWEKLLSVRTRKFLASIWIYSLVLTLTAWVIVMELGIFGYFPGQTDPEAIVNIVFTFLFTTVVMVCFTYLCAFAADIEERRF